MSVFVGIDITDLDIIESIHAIQSKINARATDLTKIHLTLCFLGNINRDITKRLVDVLADLEFSRFDMRLVGMCVFSRKRPSVIWIGTDDQGQKRVSELAGKIHNALKPLGLIREEFVPEEFVPHVTVFRIKNSTSNMIRELEPYKTKDFGVQHVNSIKLKESFVPKVSGYLDLHEVVAT